jgi:hypothetical protein
MKWRRPESRMLASSAVDELSVESVDVVLMDQGMRKRTKWKGYKTLVRLDRGNRLQ